MNGINPTIFEQALIKIDDGFIFEKFALQFCCQYFGYNFIPAGGIKDKGIDGFEHVFVREGYEKYIYQISVEKDYFNKIVKSIEKLNKNKIDFEKFYYITNQECKNKSKILEELYDKFTKNIQIFDLKWFSGNCNYSEGTIRVFRVFLDTYYHEINITEMNHVVEDFFSDPRLFVFLHQQLENKDDEENLETKLTDTLILYSLEGTDPNKNIFMTKNEIKSKISSALTFRPRLIESILDQRLKSLSKKPRKINYHKDKKAYCLPYDTRLEIKEKNIQDNTLYEEFINSLENKLKSYLQIENIKVKDCIFLIEKVINKIFYQQGIEFSDFVLNGQNQDAYEKNLEEIISSVVEDSSVIPKNKSNVKSCVMFTIRYLIYNGTENHKIFLKKLSNTYIMLFMLQCDPKLCNYFYALASKLEVYVCTSILIPAISEIYLEDINKRHWNLLKHSNNAGVKLIINDSILDELVAHFKMVVEKYENYYKDEEEIYLNDEMMLLYVDDILIRAYFYAKNRNHLKNFKEFIDNFIDPKLKNTKTELLEWLKEEFGIEFITDESRGIRINQNDFDLLYNALKEEKSHPIKAKIDSKIILTIYAIREKNNESSSTGIFGYKTWWLSKDTITHRVVNRLFKEKYQVSCYMRPDFLYNYISLAPSRKQIDSAYSTIFPGLLGVNISYHLPSEIIDEIHHFIKIHQLKNKARLSGALRSYIEEIKENPELKSKLGIKHFLDEKIENLQSDK